MRHVLLKATTFALAQSQHSQPIYDPIKFHGRRRAIKRVHDYRSVIIVSV